MAKNKDLLELIWEFFQYYFQNKNLRKRIFSESRGKKFLIELNNNSNIAKYQWNYESNGIYNLLEHYYIPTFLKKMTRIAIDHKIDKTLVDSSGILKELFEEQFSVLEKDIILSDSFQYTIYIPVFRVHFPKEEKEIIFDAKHRLLDITEIDEPFEVINFKDIPQSWDRSKHSEANGCFIAEYEIKKRMSNDNPYEEKFHPIMPYSPYSKYNILQDKVVSIYEFFLCYGNQHNLDQCTFSDQFFVKIPPFSSPLKDISKFHTYSGFPADHSYISFDRPEYINWVDLWRKNYYWFYKSFYMEDPMENDTIIFRYALEVLRTLRNIKYVHIKNFLLISILESLIIHKDLKKLTKSPDNSKSWPVAVTFVKLSEHEKNYWQHIFQSKYPLKIPLKNFETKEDLKSLIISCFRYRNKIAHADIGNLDKLNLEPKYLKHPNSNAPDSHELELLINLHFPYLIIFILRIWLKYKKVNGNSWKNYLISLFKKKN
jgi:hypothetical protein